MPKVVANEKGYFGGEIREMGDDFNVPDEIWNDQKRRPKWARLKGSTATIAKPEPVTPAGDDGSTAPKIVVPADWQNMKAPAMKGLASEIAGTKVPNKEEAEKIIAAYVEASKPEPFAEAPAPAVAQANGVAEALGKVADAPAPDWLAPADTGPQAVND